MTSHLKGDAVGGIYMYLFSLASSISSVYFAIFKSCQIKPSFKTVSSTIHTRLSASLQTTRSGWMLVKEMLGGKV